MFLQKVSKQSLIAVNAKFKLFNNFESKPGIETI